MSRISYISTVETWKKMGSKSIHEVAKEKVKEILVTHKPSFIDEEVQGKIFQILKRAETELLNES